MFFPVSCFDYFTFGIKYFLSCSCRTHVFTVYACLIHGKKLTKHTVGRRNPLQKRHNNESWHSNLWMFLGHKILWLFRTRYGNAFVRRGGGPSVVVYSSSRSFWQKLTFDPSVQRWVLLPISLSIYKCRAHSLLFPFYGYSEPEDFTLFCNVLERILDRNEIPIEDRDTFWDAFAKQINICAYSHLN